MKLDLSELIPQTPKHPIAGLRPRHMPGNEYAICSERREFENQRLFWNEVYRSCSLPRAIKRDMRQRVNSKREDQFVPALFELFVYELLKRVNLTVTAGTVLPRGVPDFRVRGTRKTNFHLEVTCDMGDAIPDAEQRRRDRIIETINSTDSSEFRVKVSLAGHCAKDPKYGRFRNEFRSWLNSLDHEELLKAQLQRLSRFENPVKVFELEGLKIFVQPIAVEELRESKGSGLILLEFGGSVAVDTGERLSKKLKEKAKQTRGARLPVVIAVNEVGEFLDEGDILTCLVGEIGFDNHNVIRDSTGLWGNGTKLKNSHIKAVMFFNQIGFFAEPVVQPVFVLNPFTSQSQLPLDLACLEYYKPSADYLSLVSLSGVTGFHPARILQNWPFGTIDPKPALRV